MISVTFPQAIVDQDLPDFVEARQAHQITEPHLIAEKLTHFWQPIWYSDGQPTQAQVDDFLALVDALPFALPEHKVDTDLASWKQAIRHLKGGTARGFDRVSGWEVKILPDRLIECLASTMLSYTSGYPADFMCARTCPISKVDAIPVASQVRPITILPLLFRVYSAVVCKQILQRWNTFFPASVKGLLPTRGAHGAAFDSQVILEQSHFTGQDTTGVTLDLRRCCNHIWHTVGPPLLRRLGVEQAAIDRWHCSISRLQLGHPIWLFWADATA